MGCRYTINVTILFFNIVNVIHGNVILEPLACSWVTQGTTCDYMNMLWFVICTGLSCMKHENLLVIWIFPPNLFFMHDRPVVICYFPVHRIQLPYV